MIDKVYKSDFEPFDNWHKGRNRYAVWMYRFDDIKLKQLVLKLQKELNQYIAIKPFTKHHLTVTAAGFPCKLARLDDDISFDAISAFTQTLINQELCPPIIRLEKLSSFPHCAYIYCNDITGSTYRAHQILNNKRGEFIPHITLGIYLENKNFNEISDFFKQRIPQIDLEVDSLECVSFSSKPLNHIPICPDDYQSLSSIRFKKSDL